MWQRSQWRFWKGSWVFGGLWGDFPVARILLVTSFSGHLRCCRWSTPQMGPPFTSAVGPRRRLIISFQLNGCCHLQTIHILPQDEVLSISLQSSLFIFHFLGLFRMCPVCQGRRVALSRPPPLFGFRMILLCASHNSGLKKKQSYIFKFWNNFRLWEKLGKCSTKHSCILFIQIAQMLTFYLCCYSLSVSILLLLLVKPFESKLQTWCPFTPEHLCVYVLKNNAIFCNQYSY